MSKHLKHIITFFTAMIAVDDKWRLKYVTRIFKIDNQMAIRITVCRLGLAVITNFSLSFIHPENYESYSEAELAHVFEAMGLPHQISIDLTAELNAILGRSAEGGDIIIPP